MYGLSLALVAVLASIVSFVIRIGWVLAGLFVSRSDCNSPAAKSEERSELGLLLGWRAVGPRFAFLASPWRRASQFDRWGTRRS